MGSTGVKVSEIKYTYYIYLYTVYCWLTDYQPGRISDQILKISDYQNLFFVIWLLIK